MDRSERNRTGLFCAEGCRSFFSALDTGWTIHAILYCPKLLRSQSVWERLPRVPVPRVKVSLDDYMRLSRRSEPDGIAFVCQQRWQRLIDQQPGTGCLWVALDSVRTPGNLGTILRTCAAVGARGVLLIGGEADPYDPASIRASMGSVFSVPLIRTSGKALEGWKSRRRIHFVGTSPLARADYRSVALRPPIVLMMGSERSGLRERQISLCDEIVRLPMVSSVDSLNLAVATSVMLYAVQK